MVHEDIHSGNAKVAAAVRVDCARLQKRLAFATTASFESAGRSSSEGDESQAGEEGGFEELHCGRSG